MSNISSIQIVYLIEGKTELTKINISDLCYQQLISKISENYSLSSDCIYHLYYQNSLNQTITISSQEDLEISFTQNINMQYYLSEVKEPQFHWLLPKSNQVDTIYAEQYIKQKKQALGKQLQEFKQRIKQRVGEQIKNKIICIEKKYISNDNDALHRGIYCNDCNQQIRGDRYRCLVCQQYNLCSKCEFINSIHDENHPFLKIINEIQNSLKQQSQSLVYDEGEIKFVEFTSTSKQTYCKIKNQYPKATDSQLIEYYFARQ